MIRPQNVLNGYFGAITRDKTKQRTKTNYPTLIAAINLKKIARAHFHRLAGTAIN